MSYFHATSVVHCHTFIIRRNDLDGETFFFLRYNSSTPRNLIKTERWYCSQASCNWRFVEIFKNCLCQLPSCANQWRMYDYFFEICPRRLITTERWYCSQASCNWRFVEIFKNCLCQLPSCANQLRMYDFFWKMSLQCNLTDYIYQMLFGPVSCSCRLVGKNLSKNYFFLRSTCICFFK